MKHSSGGAVQLSVEVRIIEIICSDAVGRRCNTRTLYVEKWALNIFIKNVLIYSIQLTRVDYYEAETTTIIIVVIRIVVVIIIIVFF